MGLGQSKLYKNYILNFDDMKIAVERGYIICHIMDEIDGTILIKNTLSVKDEIKKINDLIKQSKFDETIVLYGRNYTDLELIVQRFQHLISFGFTRVFIYVGGLYEWILMQNLYGDKLFPTNVIVDFIDAQSVSPQRCEKF